MTRFHLPSFLLGLLFLASQQSKVNAFTTAGSQKHIWNTSHGVRHKINKNSFPILSSEVAGAIEARNSPDDDDVKVTIIEDVDPVTLTALGFGLIAFNFFVFANLGKRFYL